MEKELSQITKRAAVYGQRWNSYRQKRTKNMRLRRFQVDEVTISLITSPFLSLMIQGSNGDGTLKNKTITLIFRYQCNVLIVENQRKSECTEYYEK